MKNILIGVLVFVSIISLGSAIRLYMESREIPAPISLEATVSQEYMIKAGKVTGKLGYPSDFLPEGKLIAKNILNGYEFSQPVNTRSLQYEFTLPEGTYHFKYDTGAESGYAGYYTTISECIASVECPKKGTIKTVSVQAGKITTNVNINDFYSDLDPSVF